VSKKKQIYQTKTTAVITKGIYLPVQSRICINFSKINVHASLSQRRANFQHPCCGIVSFCNFWNTWNCLQEIAIYIKSILCCLTSRSGNLRTRRYTIFFLNMQESCSLIFCCGAPLNLCVRGGGWVWGGGWLWVALSA